MSGRMFATRLRALLDGAAASNDVGDGGEGGAAGLHLRAAARRRPDPASADLVVWVDVMKAVNEKEGKNKMSISAVSVVFVTWACTTRRWRGGDRSVQPHAVDFERGVAHIDAAAGAHKHSRLMPGTTPLMLGGSCREQRSQCTADVPEDRRRSCPFDDGTTHRGALGDARLEHL